MAATVATLLASAALSTLQQGSLLGPLVPIVPHIEPEVAPPPPRVTYVGADHVLVYHPLSALYSLHKLARFARPPCLGIAGEPVFAVS